MVYVYSAGPERCSVRALAASLGRSPPDASPFQYAMEGEKLHMEVTYKRVKALHFNNLPRGKRGGAQGGAPTRKYFTS